MKTSFKIAVVDDNFSGDEMKSMSDDLGRDLSRKNGFSLKTWDVYADVMGDDFDSMLANLSNTIDLSNSIDLIMVDYELAGAAAAGGEGDAHTGGPIAKKFRDKLPSVDIIFYSGKESVQSLRSKLAESNVDCVNCVGRDDLTEDTYRIIENIIDRSYKISTLRGLILNSVCEMDHMIVDILCKYSAASAAQLDVVKDKAVSLISNNSHVQEVRLLGEPVKKLLQHDKMMSGKLFSIFKKIYVNLGLSAPQLTLLDKYRNDILDLRTSAAHAKEGTCPATKQSMLKFKKVEIKRCDIDGICKIIVEHEKNIKLILDGMA